MNDFVEPLPEGCPPEDAQEISGPRIVFRLVRHSPPTKEDFKSQRAGNPNVQFNTSECLARGLSVRLKRTDLENLLKLPKFRGSLIGRVTLLNGAGYIKQTGQRSHYTWWPFAAFDILGNSQVV